jgi:hypothetical protein
MSIRPGRLRLLASRLGSAAAADKGRSAPATQAPHLRPWAMATPRVAPPGRRYRPIRGAAQGRCRRTKRQLAGIVQPAPGPAGPSDGTGLRPLGRFSRAESSARARMLRHKSGRHARVKRIADRRDSNKGTQSVSQANATPSMKSTASPAMPALPPSPRCFTIGTLSLTRPRPGARERRPESSISAQEPCPLAGIGEPVLAPECAPAARSPRLRSWGGFRTAKAAPAPRSQCLARSARHAGAERVADQRDDDEGESRVISQACAARPSGRASLCWTCPGWRHIRGMLCPTCPPGRGSRRRRRAGSISPRRTRP